MHYEIYAPTYGVRHGLQLLDKADNLKLATALFKAAKKRGLYVQCKEVTTTKKTIMVEHPNVAHELTATNKQGD